MEDRSSNRRIILNSVYIYIGVIFTTLFHFVTIPLLLNYLGEGDYGLYTLILVGSEMCIRDSINCWRNIYACFCT